MNVIQFLFTSCFHRFDCEFVTSEVNANIHYFVKTDSGFKLAGSNNDNVGKNMSTKAAGSDSSLIDCHFQLQAPQRKHGESSCTGEG